MGIRGRVSRAKLSFAGVATGIVLAGLARELLLRSEPAPERVYALLAALAAVAAWLRDETKNGRRNGAGK